MLVLVIDVVNDRIIVVKLFVGQSMISVVYLVWLR